MYIYVILVFFDVKYITYDGYSCCVRKNVWVSLYFSVSITQEYGCMYNYLIHATQFDTAIVIFVLTMITAIIIKYIIYDVLTNVYSQWKCLMKYFLELLRNWSPWVFVIEIMGFHCGCMYVWTVYLVGSLSNTFFGAIYNYRTRPNASGPSSGRNNRRVFNSLTSFDRHLSPYNNDWENDIGANVIFAMNHNSIDIRLDICTYVGILCIAKNYYRSLKSLRLYAVCRFSIHIRIGTF